MTGNKQFVSIDDGLDFSIKHIGSGEVFYDCDSVVELLNEFNDENKELKKENEQLRKELDSFKPVMFQDMRKGTIRLYAKGGTDE